MTTLPNFIAAQKEFDRRRTHSVQSSLIVPR